MTFEEIQLKAFDLTWRESAKLQRQMIAEYDQALISIKSEIQKIYLTVLDGVPKDKYFVTMTKYNRLVKLYESIQSLYMGAAKSVKGLMIENSELSLSNVYYRQFYAINWTQVSSVSVVLHPAVIEASVYSTSKIWDKLSKEAQQKVFNTFGTIDQYYPQSGTLLDTLLKKNNANTLFNLENSLRQSLLQGLSYTQTAKDIRSIMGNSVNNSLRIAVTEGHRNMTTGNYAMMEAAQSEGIDARRKIVSVRDLRTRQQSASVDGKFENKDGYFVYPGGVLVKIPGNSGVAKWDINDRESVVVVVDGFDSDITRARNPVTGETDIINNNSYEEWMKQNNIKYNKYGKMYVSE